MIKPKMLLPERKVKKTSRLTIILILFAMAAAFNVDSIHAVNKKVVKNQESIAGIEVMTRSNIYAIGKIQKNDLDQVNPLAKKLESLIKKVDAQDRSIDNLMKLLNQKIEKEFPGNG